MRRRDDGDNKKIYSTNLSESILEALMSSFSDRLIGAAKLDVKMYEEVEADRSALNQAMSVVILSSVAAGIGIIGTAGFKGILMGTIVALIAWFVWAYLTYFIGTKILPEPQTKADLGELLRTIGFSSSPGLIRVLGIIPGLSFLVYSVAGIWMLVAMVVAIRQALDYHSTWRAVGVCIVGWIIQALTITLFLSMFGGVQKPV